MAEIELTFTGERVIPGHVEPDLWNEHVARYHFAALFAPGRTVLDIGCGSGYGTDLLAGCAHQAVGCDISLEAIAYARARTSNGHFLVASASALPQRYESFGLVTAFEVIEHLQDWTGLILEAARVLSANGVFLVSTPNKTYYAETRGEAGPNEFHEHEFELEEFHEALAEVFPYVHILGQNHQASVVFSSAETPLKGNAFVPALSDCSSAHFFVAVCSKEPVEIPSFAYIPATFNLLRERERHIRLLQAELQEARAEHASLLSIHRSLNCELEERNEWARGLDRELLANTMEMRRRAAESQKISDRFAALRKENGELLNALEELQNALEKVRKSFWLRVGRALDIGPWTEGRFHLKRIGRSISAWFLSVSAWLLKLPGTRAYRFAGHATQVARSSLLYLVRRAISFVWHVVKLVVSVLLLAFSAGLFAAEDLCFRCAGKRQIKPETRVSHQAASVIITNWNGRELLESFLPSVIAALAGNERNEIIVVDNASSDESAHFVRTRFPGVRVLEMPRNLGFGGGCNAGVRAAKNEVVVLLNNDMQVEPDFLAPLLEPFADPLLFAVSAQIFFVDRTKRREETGLTEVWWEDGVVKASHRIDPEIKAAYPCAYAGGGSSAFDRHKFLELGGFDSLFEPFYYEDTDLGLLAWKRGWKVLYQPASLVHHCHRATVRKNFSGDFIQGVVNRNAILYCWKNIHDWRMFSRHFGAILLSCSRWTGRTPHQYSSGNIFQAVAQLCGAMKSRWLALSKARITDAEAFNQPLGGYFRDRFEASFSPVPERLRVLFVSPYPIEPPLHGGGVFMKQTLTQLAALADVHLVCFLDNEYQLENQQPLREICKSAQFLVRRPVPKISLTLTPWLVREFADRDFAWLVHRTMLLGEIDAVQIEYTMLGQYAGNYRHIPCLLFEHDVMSQTLRRGLERRNVSFEAVIEYLRMRFYEPRLLEQFARVQVCSQANAEYLRALAPKLRKVDIDMRAAIDIRRYSGDFLGRNPSTILFIGGFGHSPNIEGICWFITEVLDKILAVRSDVLLEIVGSNPPPGPNIWDRHPNVHMIGTVSDIRLPLQRAAIFICPILTGSGIRVKLLEAFACQIPVVSTTIGAEGLASETGIVCEIADTPEDFAASVLLLLENKAYAAKLVRQAREMVEREYDACAATVRLERSYAAEVAKVRPKAAAMQTSA